MGHSVFPIIHQLCKKKKGKNMEKENIITVDIEDLRTVSTSLIILMMTLR